MRYLYEPPINWTKLNRHHDKHLTSVAIHFQRFLINSLFELVRFKLVKELIAFLSATFRSITMCDTDMKCHPWELTTSATVFFTLCGWNHICEIAQSDHVESIYNMCYSYLHMCVVNKILHPSHWFLKACRKYFSLFYTRPRSSNTINCE